MTVAVVQLGARMHYAVPRILHSAGLLERLYTDICGTVGWPTLLRAIPPALWPNAVRKILGRRPVGIPPSRIVSFPRVGLRYAYRLRRAAERPAAIAQVHLSAGRELASRVIKSGFAGASAVYAFNSAALDVFREARELGLTTLYEQTIAPVRIEAELLKEEYTRWAGWETELRSGFYDAFAEIEQQEWALADHVVCGSEFVRAGIASLGGPAERCGVIEYGVDSPPAELRQPPAGRPLRVLTVGTVGLRKGAPYVGTVAAEMHKLAVFRWVGPVKLSQMGIRELAATVQLTGGVPRAEMAAHYRWADVLFLPSICEGSATVTYEALGYGLPIVVTPNTGAPIESRVGGSIIAIRDTPAAVAALTKYCNDPTKWSEDAEQARRTANRLTVAAYGDRLLKFVQNAGHIR